MAVIRRLHKEEATVPHHLPIRVVVVAHSHMAARPHRHRHMGARPPHRPMVEAIRRLRMAGRNHSRSHHHKAGRMAAIHLRLKMEAMVPHHRADTRHRMPRHRRRAIAVFSWVSAVVWSRCS